MKVSITFDLPAVLADHFFKNNLSNFELQPLRIDTPYHEQLLTRCISAVMEQCSRDERLFSSIKTPKKK